MRIIEEDERELCPHVRLVGEGKRCTVLDCFEPVHDMAVWAEEDWNLAGVTIVAAVRPACGWRFKSPPLGSA